MVFIRNGVNMLLYIFVKKEFKIGKILKVIRRIEKLFGIVNYIEL